MRTPPRSAVRRLGLARAISTAGSEAAFVALVATVWARTGSPAWVSAAALAAIVVRGLAAPLGGALGDRFDRRRVMIASDLGAAAAVAVLVAVGDPIPLVALAALAAAFEAPFASASGAAVPNLVPAADLGRANAHLAGMRVVGVMAGPVMGGVLVATGGAPLAFAVDAVSFLASAALVASVRGDFSAPAVRAARRGLGLGAGLAALRADVLLARLVAARTAFFLGGGVVLVAERSMVDELGGGDLGYGLLVAGWGAGVLLGTRLAVPVGADPGGAARALAGLAVAGAGIGIGGFAPSLVVLVACMAAAGIGRGVAGVAIDTALQVRTPDAVRSRVLAAAEAVGLVALGLAITAGGPIAASLGPRPAYAAAAAGSLLAVAVLLPPVRAARSGVRPLTRPAPGGAV